MDVLFNFGIHRWASILGSHHLILVGKGFSHKELELEEGGSHLYQSTNVQVNQIYY
jgi:hypothetical protein